MKGKHLVIVIRRSCLTGKAVWLYKGPSRGASWAAYWYACRREVQRVRTWCDRAMRRKSNILRLLGKCMENMPMDAVLTPEQNAAARTLRRISNEDYLPDMAFYDHCQEERRRRHSK